MKKIKLLIIGLCLTGGCMAAYALTKESVCATCSGKGVCNACKNCKYCKHCAKDGGTCSMCK